jgi:hypothetical protein
LPLFSFVDVVDPWPNGYKLPQKQNPSMDVKPISNLKK